MTADLAADQLLDLLGQRICNHAITSRTKVHPAKQDIPVLIERLHNVYKWHTVGGRPILQIRSYNTMCKKEEFAARNCTFFFQLVFHHLNFLCIPETLNILDYVGPRLLLDSHKNDSSSLTFPIQRVDITNEVFARASNVIFNLSAVESRLSYHVLQKAIDKRDRDEVVTRNPIC